jgi:DNA-binding transcriptional ArsR family regulator
MNGYTAWARQQKLPGWGHSQHVLLEKLGEETDRRTDLAIVSIGELAKAVGLDKRQVERHIAKYVSLGLVQRIARFAPRRQVENAYRLLTQWVKAALERREAPAAEDWSLQQLDPRRARLFTLASGELACIHQGGPPCDECSP